MPSQPWRAFRYRMRLRIKRFRQLCHRWWVRVMWLGVAMVGLSIIVIAASIVAPSVVGFEASDLSLAGAGGDDVDSPDDINESEIRSHLLIKLNEYRIAKGRSRLSRSDRLVDAAELHSNDMAEKSYLAHREPDGDVVADRYRAAGVRCRDGAENVAMTYWGRKVEVENGSTEVYGTEKEIAHAIIRQFKNSRPHRKIMLSPDAVAVGHGVEATREDDGVIAVYVTQNYC